MQRRARSVEFAAGNCFALALALLLSTPVWGQEPEAKETSSPSPSMVVVAEVVQRTTPPDSEFMVASASLGAAVVSPLMGGQVCIQVERLEPPLLFVEPERRVEFFNRSGRLVYIAFEPRDTDVHPDHLVQAMDAIWVVFHESGAHRFLIHFLDPGMRDLEGTVVVGEHFYGGLDQPVCGGITIHGGCIEP